MTFGSSPLYRAKNLQHKTINLILTLDFKQKTSFLSALATYKMINYATAL